MSTDVAKTSPAHLWQKGRSGNPAGRPKGSKNAISLIKLQVEGELRGRMKTRMADVVEEMFRQALPQTLADGSVVPGDKDMLKTLFKSWVSSTKASDDDAPKEKILIQIGKLEKLPDIQKVPSTFDNNEE